MVAYELKMLSYTIIYSGNKTQLSLFLLLLSSHNRYFHTEVRIIQGIFNIMKIYFKKNLI